MERLFITTPIYYVNAKPHLGHAYTTVVADTLARFHSLMGQQTYFLTGTDEHGDKIVKAAMAANQSPKEYADHFSGLFRELWSKLNVANDQFIRTTESKHVKVVQEILQKIYDVGDIYFGEYGGYYCFGCERFHTEKELVDGLCSDHKTKPEYIAEKNYFFRMSKYQSWLVEHIKNNPDFIRPKQYRTEILSLLESGALEDLCISRPKSRLTWGVDLPFDTNYVCYVWFDALINYISALGWPRGDRFKKFWPKANHIVAKDILKPHAVFWPTMLKAAGVPPHRKLNVHGYWLSREAKMSKSLGNVVEPLQLVELYGPDAFRYFLLREMVFGMDASFSEEALIGRLNADLANDLGNLLNRSLAMCHKYFDGKVPTPTEETLEDAEVKRLGREVMGKYQTKFDDGQFSRGLEDLWELVRGLNKYIDKTAPWTLYKNKNIARLSTVIYVLLENIRKIAVHLWPVMPTAAERILKQLGMSFDKDKIFLPKELDAWGILESGHIVDESSNMFPRIELPEPAPQPKPDGAPGPVPKVEPLPEVGFEDFQKLDIRVGIVLEACRHPDADKLLVLRVDLGETEPRQIVSGIAEFFKPEALSGRQVMVLANLKPRKIRKQLSQGMVLTVKTAEGLDLLTTSQVVLLGSRVS